MLKYDLDRKSLIRFYLSFIRPILEYGNIIWDGCNKLQSDLLESIQLDAARIITVFVEEPLTLSFTKSLVGAPNP